MYTSTSYQRDGLAGAANLTPKGRARGGRLTAPRPPPSSSSPLVFLSRQRRALSVAPARAADSNANESPDASERRRQDRLQARLARQAEAAAAAAAASPPAAAAADDAPAEVAAAAPAAQRASPSSSASRRSGGGRLRRAAAVAARRRGAAGGAGQLLAARLDVPEDDDDDDDEEVDGGGSGDAPFRPPPLRAPAPSSAAEAPQQKKGGRRTKGGDGSDAGSQPNERQEKKQQKQQQQNQQQQQQQRPTPVFLDESSPFYQPALTDDDLGDDPPGHRSGYVAVIGRPNAGKSTLINALVGQKLCAVSPRPQTTRHRVVGLASAPDHQMVLFDTPGIVREQRSRLEGRMMAAVVSSIRSAEAIVAVVDAADDPREALAMFQPGADWDGPPMAVLLNKADALLALPVAPGAEGGAEGEELGPAPIPPRPRAGEGGGGWGGDGSSGGGGEGEGGEAAGSAAAQPEQQQQGSSSSSPLPTAEQRAAAERRLAELEAWYRANCRAEAVFVGSARRGAADAGVAAVRAWAVSRLPEGPTLYPKSMVSEQPERFFVAEIIRERIFELYGQEIPYAAQVQVEEFRERRRGGGGGAGGGKGKKEERGDFAGEAEEDEAEEEEQQGGGDADDADDADASSSPRQQQPQPSQPPPAKDYISASILLERESQVAIVVGTGGRKLKRLGAEARREVEAFLGRPVYLELAVRVAAGWRESPEKLREFGYYSDLYI